MDRSTTEATQGTPVEVWAPAFAHVNIEWTVAWVLPPAPSWASSSVPWCRLCEQRVPHGERKQHVRDHKAEYEAWQRGNRKAVAAEDRARLRSINRERALEARVLGGAATPQPTNEEDPMAKSKAEKRIAEITKELEQEPRLTNYRLYEKAVRDQRAEKLTPDEAAKVKDEHKADHSAWWKLYEERRALLKGGSVREPQAEGSKATPAKATSKSTKKQGAAAAKAEPEVAAEAEATDGASAEGGPAAPPEAEAPSEQGEEVPAA